jgi:hypothetical protein
MSGASASGARRGEVPDSRAARAVILAAVLCVFGAAQLAVAPPAGAIRGLTTALASGSYGNPNDAVRNHWFDTTVQANAGIVRIAINWAVAGPQPLADPRDPADPGYNFAAVDRAVRAAAQRGLEAYFTIALAPSWAEGPNRPAESDPGILGPGAWRPDPRALGDFATALATRYSGSFPDPATDQPLPRVRYYEAWNEPNIPQFLAPQYEGGKPTGVNIYRDLLRAVSDAIRGSTRGTSSSGRLWPPMAIPPPRLTGRGRSTSCASSSASRATSPSPSPSAPRSGFPPWTSSPLTRSTRAAVRRTRRPARTTPPAATSTSWCEHFVSPRRQSTSVRAAVDRCG